MICSTMFLFAKYIQNLLFDTRDANFILFGGVSELKALMYSICGTSWIVLKIIAWSFFGKETFAVVSAKVFCVFGCGDSRLEGGGLISGSSDMSDGLVGVMTNWLRGAVIKEHTFLIAVKFS